MAAIRDELWEYCDLLDAADWCDSDRVNVEKELAAWQRRIDATRQKLTDTTRKHRLAIDAADAKKKALEASLPRDGVWIIGPHVFRMSADGLIMGHICSPDTDLVPASDSSQGANSSE